MELFDKNKFATKKELFAFLKENKKSLIAQKKATIKHADGISFYFRNDKILANKTQKATSNENYIDVTFIGNTTYYMDSHDDVHIDGLWTKTLNEQKFLIHNQEHKPDFKYIISDGEDFKVSTKMMNWNELNVDFIGKTQALIGKSRVFKERNEEMFTNYINGWVRQHSVEMYYVKLELAMNSQKENDTQEFAVWQKYIDRIANQDYVYQKGFFWAVTEAKLTKISAVPQGSNPITPTQEVKSEPLKGTQQHNNEPSERHSLSQKIINLLN